jgi:hypothetical protein
VLNCRKTNGEYINILKNKINEVLQEAVG